MGSATRGVEGQFLVLCEIAHGATEWHRSVTPVPTLALVPAYELRFHDLSFGSSEFVADKLVFLGAPSIGPTMARCFSRL